MPHSPVDQVVDVFQKWLYLPKPDALLAVLGTVAANRLDGDPVWLMVVGPPGGGKSEVLQSVMGLADTYATATMTERALLSGTAKKEREADAKGGLLKEIGNFGILVCKDFGSLLSMHHDERARTMAALREIYDGSWTRHVGVDGGRTLHWAGKVGLIVGVTPTIDRHHGVMGAMGERFVLMRLPIAERSAQARRSLAHAGQEKEMRAELAGAVKDLFAKSHTTIIQKSSQEEDRLISLATFVASCRSSVERDGYSREIELVPESESPTRLVVVLDRLLNGLKAIGVEHDRAWRVVTEIGLDSMPRLRHDVIQVLYGAAGEELETGEIATLVNHPTTTTRRALEDLDAHLVVGRKKHGKGHSDTWRLSGDASKALQAAGSAVPEKSDPLKAAKRSRNSAQPHGTRPKAKALTPIHAYDDFSGTPSDESENGVPGEPAPVDELTF